MSLLDFGDKKDTFNNATVTSTQIGMIGQNCPSYGSEIGRVDGSGIVRSTQIGMIGQNCPSYGSEIGRVRR